MKKKLLKSYCPRCNHELMLDIQDIVPFCVLCGYYDWTKDQIYSSLVQYSNSDIFPVTKNRYSIKQAKAGGE